MDEKPVNSDADERMVEMMTSNMMTFLVSRDEVLEVLEKYNEEHPDCSTETFLALHKVFVKILDLQPEAYIFNMTGDVIKCRKEKTA